MKLNDGDIVTWVCHGHRNMTTVAAARHAASRVPRLV
jgi:hypothetical protein